MNTSCTVFEADSAPIKSGLVDVDGVPLVRIQPRAPIGFKLGGKET
jgi:hypothetical protein